MDRIKNYADTLIEEGIPYLDIIVHKDNAELYRYYNGRGKTTGKEKLYMYSCTKPLTVSTAMRLVEEGRLGIDDPVEKYLPAFADAYLLDENGNRVAPKNKVTVRHLFTMTAGLSYDKNRYPTEEAYKNRGAKSATVAVAESYARTPLISEPGERFRYSLCHDALGAVIEVASGMAFSEYMAKTLFRPLGMKNTYFASSRDESVADLYEAHADKSITPCEKENALIYYKSYESGGAGVISTVEDYARFGAMLAAGGVGVDGTRILKEESIRALYSKQLSSVSIESGFTCVQGDAYGYGLGVRTRTVPTEWGLPIGEFGWDGAAGSYLMVDPVNRVSVVIGMHVRNWPPVFVGKHLEIVKRIYEAFDIGKK